MFKKSLLPFLLVGLLSLILVGCSDGNDSEEASGSSDSNDSEEASGSSDNGEAASETNFPEESIQIVVPFDAGGGTDAVARSLANNTEKHIDSNLAVINVSGGGGATGMTQVANENPDGYNLLLATVELTTLPPMGLSDVTHEDFQPIAQINMDPGAITVQSNSEWETVEEFIEYAENNPGEVSIGNAGTGSIWHLVASSIERELELEFNHVPYDGAAPAVTALMAGEVDAITVSPAEVLSQVEGGDLKTLAITADERADIMPDVPTMEEAGYDNLVTGTWRGVVAPADLPDEEKAVLEEAFVKGAEEEEFAEFMDNNGLGLRITGADEFEEFISNASNEWATIIEELGL